MTSHYEEKLEMEERAIMRSTCATPFTHQPITLLTNQRTAVLVLPMRMDRALALFMLKFFR